MAILSSIVFSALAGIAQAQVPVQQDVPIPPKAPPPQGDEGTPQVTIRNTRDGDRYEEYRQNGAVYMVRVVPKHGIPYTLIDENRDGRLDHSDISKNDVSPVYYTIYEWN
jgi:hypothetical protein